MPGTGVDAVVYAIPDMNMIVRFTTRAREYRHSDKMMLGSTRPNVRSVMQNFMEFSVPNPNGPPLYIEIAAKGRDVGQFLADYNAMRLKWHGITGRNPNPIYAHRNDFAQTGNQKRFGGQTKLIDTGEMDDEHYRPPSQSTDWKSMDEYKEITPEARKGKWFDPKVHAQLYERQLERNFHIEKAILEKALKHTPNQRHLDSAINMYTRRFGPAPERVDEALAFIHRGAGEQPLSAASIQELLSSACNRHNEECFESILSHALKHKLISPQDLVKPSAGKHSLMEMACKHSPIIRVISKYINPQELSVEPSARAEDSLLSRAIRMASDSESIAYIAAIPGMDLTQRDSHGEGYLDKLANAFYRAAEPHPAFEIDVQECIEKARMHAKSIKTLQEIMRKNGVNPEDAAQANGSYTRFASQQAKHVQAEELKRQVNMAWSNMRLP